MKIKSVRTSLLALLLGAATITPAMASSVFVSIGSQPPPPVRYQQPWQPPHQSAVWIPAHNEWRGGRYVWVSGYYTYPPRPRAVWVGPTYQHAPNGYYYRQGYWR